MLTRALCLSLAAVALLAGPCRAQPISQGPYEFAADYIRMTGALEDIRERGQKDMEGDENRMESCVRNMEAFQLELGADILVLKAVKLPGEFSDVPNMFVRLLTDKRDVYREIGDNCATMIVPQQGVDYGAIAAKAPKLTARLEYLDHALFEASPMVFLALVSRTPDAKGHISHLSITRAQMNDLAQSIKAQFGNKLGQPNPTYGVNSMALIYDALTKKGYKGGDEP